MTLEHQERASRSAPDFIIIGEGNIGEKARQLMTKTPTLKELGFCVPQRIVLAEGFFDDFFQRNGLGNSLANTAVDTSTEKAVRNGRFSREGFETIALMTASHQEKPLVVRSSAEGDARGTGTYKSVFTECTAGSIRKAVQEVLASYFTPSATAFRKDAQTGEGFAVMVEPLIGQQLQDENSPLFGPVLSGFGYTSTSQGEGYINVVPGVGGGVETRYTERLTRKMLEPSKGLLQDYISSQRNLIVHGMIAKRESALMRTTRGDMAGDYEGSAYFPTQRSGQYYQKGGVYPTGLDFNKDIFFALHKLNILPFFNKIEALEKKIGRTQYFEWAMTFEGRQPKYWIIQIADIAKKADAFDFEDYGEYFIAGHTVTGTGIVDTDTVVCCGDPARLDELHAFNQTHKGYALFYTGDLISRGKNEFRAMHRGRELSYDDINNAAVIIEINNCGHANSPLEHFKGQLDMTGKLFGVIELKAYDQDFWDKWYDFWRTDRAFQFLSILSKNIRVVGSERQNRIVVYNQSDTPVDS